MRVLRKIGVKSIKKYERELRWCEYRGQLGGNVWKSMKENWEDASIKDNWRDKVESIQSMKENWDDASIKENWGEKWEKVWKRIEKM